MSYFGVFNTGIMYYAWNGNISEIIFFQDFFAPIASYRAPGAMIFIPKSRAHIMTLLNYYSLMPIYIWHKV